MSAPRFGWSPAALLAAALLLWGPAGLAAEALSEREEGGSLLRRVEARYASLPGLKADFVQIWRPSRFGEEVRESGTLWIRRPGMARWEYTDPEHKVALVTSSRETWFYVPDERQAVHGRLPGDLPPHLSLLMGEEGISDAFEVTGMRRGEPGPDRLALAVLEMVPRREDPSIGRIVLTLETEPVRVISISVEGETGERTEYILTRTEEGFVAPDSLFAFTPPEGVEVLDTRRQEGALPAP